jgi:hypothetical protein
MNTSTALGLAMIAAAALTADDDKSRLFSVGRGSNPRRVRYCPKCGKSTHKDGYGRESCDFCPWPE